MNKRFKIVHLYDTRKGEGKYGPWFSKEVVVEEINDEVQYPNQLCLTLTGEQAEKFNLSVGDEVRFQSASRVRTITYKKGTPEEYEAGVTEHKCWKIENVYDSLPF